MHKSLVKLLAAAVAVATLFASTPSALAQGITTAALTGTVSDNSGKPIGGATITVVHEPSGTRLTTTSRANGQFDAAGLRVGGPYTVTASSSDFKSSSQSDLYLEVGDTGSANLKLVPDVIEMAAFNVTADRNDVTFGAGKIGTGSSFNAEEIENTPTVRRNIQDIATLDTRITILSLDQGGNMSASGQNHRFNSFLVDGVQSSDTFGLNGNGFSSQRSPIPLEAIASFSAELTPYDVRRAGFTGALINAVIKSGTNEYHGTVYGEKTKQNWRAVNPVNQVRDAFDEKTIGFGVGGPIIKNKLFFYVHYEKFERTAAPPSANFVPDATQFGAIAARATALGYDIGNLDAVNKSFQEVKIAKIDWNINDKHRISYTYNKNEGEDTSFSEIGGATTTSTSNYWFQQPRVRTSHTALFFSNWTPDFRTELGYSTNKYDGSPKNNGTPFPRVQVNGIPGVRRDNGLTATGAVVFGTENSRQLNKITTDEKLWKFTGEYSFGNHTLAFGAEDDVTEYLNKFVQNVNGNYTFSNLAAWQAGTPVSAFTLAKLNPGFTLDNAFAQWKYDARAFFIEDTWRSADQKLTILAGLRYDVPLVPDAPPVATGFEAGFGIRNNTTNDGNYTLAPRLGFNYEFKTERKTQLRGGIGLFQGKNPAVWISNAYSNAGSIGNVTVNNPAGFVFQADPNAQVAPAGNPPAPNINVTDPNLKQPVSWKSNLAFDHKLPFGNIVFTAEIGYLRVNKALTTEYLNYLTATTGPATLPDGRIRFNGAPTPTGTFAVAGITTLAQAQAAFGTVATAVSSTTGAVSFSGASLNGRRRVNTGGPTGAGFADVFRLTNTDQGESTDYSLSLRRGMKNNWAWSIGYTHNNSTEVSPMTSSTASSNYSNRASVNPNEDIASTSNYQIKDRIVATFTRQFEFVKRAKTTVQLVYQGRTGRPYSWIFRGDANGDGFSFNDLLYVPTGPDDPKVRFASTTERDAYFLFAANNGLSKYAGTNAPRNSESSPWMQTLDLKFTQQIPLYRDRVRAELYLNVINFANLFNKNWGIQEEVPFSYKRAVAGATFDAAANGGTGQWVYTFNSTTLDAIPVTANDTPISRWQVQAGMRVKF